MHVKSAEAKRRHVLEASADVFRMHGYSRTTMGDLAKAAGMSRPALYLVFPRKEQVFCSLLDNAAEVLADEDSAGRTYTSLVSWLLWACGLWTGEERLEAREEETAALSEKHSEYMLIAGLLREGIARRLPVGENAEAAQDVARLIATAMRGLCEAPLAQAERRRLLALQVRSLVEASGWADRARASRAAPPPTLM